MLFGYRGIYSTEDFAKFEALKFKIYDEYGIYESHEEEPTIEDIRPLGKGKRYFKSEKSKEKFILKYKNMMKEHYIT